MIKENIVKYDLQFSKEDLQSYLKEKNYSISNMVEKFVNYCKVHNVKFWQVLLDKFIAKTPPKVFYEDLSFWDNKQEYKVTYLANGSMKIESFKCKKKSNRGIGNRGNGGGVKYKDEFKTIKSYEKTLSKFKENCLGLDIDYEHCLFVTLTQDSRYTLDYNAISKAFTKYIANIAKSLKIKISTVKTIRRIEMQRQRKWHIHALLQFERVIKRREIDNMRDLWVYSGVASDGRHKGTVIEKIDKNVNKVCGYFTNRNRSDYKDKTFTFIPKAAQCVSMSKNWDKVATVEEIWNEDRVMQFRKENESCEFYIPKKKYKRDYKDKLFYEVKKSEEVG